MNLAFPRTLDAVAPQWLSEVLQSDGVIGDAAIADLHAGPVLS